MLCTCCIGWCVWIWMCMHSKRRLNSYFGLWNPCGVLIISVTTKLLLLKKGRLMEREPVAPLKLRSGQVIIFSQCDPSSHKANPNGSRLASAAADDKNKKLCILQMKIREQNRFIFKGITKCQKPVLCLELKFLCWCSFVSYPINVLFVVMWTRMLEKKNSTWAKKVHFCVLVFIQHKQKLLLTL